jgi:asparagine synthase (glutamine-hydrolysing)
MAASLELRAPYFQHELIEFANSIPASLKLTNTTKFILKEALRGILPDKIIDRPKQGFGIPLKQWLGNEFRDLAEELLLSERTRARKVFNYDIIVKYLKDHSRVNHTDRLWSLMCLEKWFRICHDPFIL